MIFKPILSLAPVLVFAGCVAPPSAPAPAPAPPPPRPAPPPPAALPGERALPVAWEDRPATPGTWVYRADARGSIALFGMAGQDALMTLRCEIASHRLFLSVPGSVAGALTLRATTGATTYPAQSAGGAQPYVAAEITPRDPQLDAIAFSRGHFLVSLAGGAELVLPIWPEFTRVVEDCRG